MAETVYVLCALTSVLCAALLFRAYRGNRSRLLLWSTLCFVGLALNNVLLFVDLVLVPGPILDLRWARTGTALMSLATLVIGLVWESK
jgi:hypothetical protein